MESGTRKGRVVLSITTSAPPERQPAIGRCPRCGEMLPKGAYWEPMAVFSGRTPAYRVRHKRTGGGVLCTSYSGVSARDYHETLRQMKAHLATYVQAIRDDMPEALRAKLDAEVSRMVCEVVIDPDEPA